MDLEKESNDKPRRLEEETALYLSQIEGELDTCDDSSVLVENVLDEIKQRTASASCDRRTNYVIEKLCYKSNILQILELMNRLIPYASFLCSNRYSSHTIQALCSRLCYLMKIGDVENVNASQFITIVLGLVQPVLDNFIFFACDMNGSHVLRSMLSVLAGIPVVSERKSKNAKHVTTTSLSQPLETITVPGGFHIDTSCTFPVPIEFHEVLGEAAAKLLDVSSSQLQDMIADASGSVAFSLLLRILFNPQLIEGGGTLADRLARRSLEWSEDNTNIKMNDLSAEAAARGAQVVYAMAGDTSGSRFLETVIECSGLQLLMQIIRDGLCSTPLVTIAEFVEDKTANFVVQSCLRRLSFEMTLCAIATYDSKTKNDLLETVSLFLSSTELTNPSLLPILVASRGGVLLWMIQLGNAYSKILIGEASSNKSGANVGETLALNVLSQWCKGSVTDLQCDSKEMAERLDKVLKSKFEVKEISKLNDALTTNGGGAKGKVNLFLKKDPAKPPPENRDPVAQLTSRILGSILSLSESSKAALLVAEAICRLSSEILLSICFSGTMSRSMIDGLYNRNDLAKQKSSLMRNLLPHAVTLSTHAIGHHVIRKCYESVSVLDKERLLTALTQEGSQPLLERCREGTATIRTTHLELFVRNVSEWKNLIGRQMKAKEMLHDLEQDASRSIVKSTSDKVDINGTINANQPLVEKIALSKETVLSSEVENASRKRKRKRNSKKKQAGDDGAGGEEDEQTQERQVAVAVQSEKEECQSHGVKKQHVERPAVKSEQEEVRNESVDHIMAKKDTKARGHPIQIPKAYNQNFLKHSVSDKGGGGNTEKADMKKLKFLKSKSMMSSKRILEELQYFQNK